VSPQRSRPSGSQIAYNGPAGVRLLAQQLGTMPAQLQKELQGRFRPLIKAAGETVKRAAAAKASWSSRIPRALRLQVSFGAKKAGLRLTVLESVAPHARPFEGITDRRNLFRHPVFGDEDVWVAQATRPFLIPALQETRAQVIADVDEAIDLAARSIGFR